MAKRRIFGRICAALTLGLPFAPGHGAAGEQAGPVFAAFQTICLDTDADPEAVAARVIRAGGVLQPSSDDWSDSDVAGSFTRMTRWSLIIAGHKTNVASSTEHIPHHGPIGTRDYEGCLIMSDDGDPRIRAAARAWAGVPPGMMPDSYNFLADDGKHRAYVDKTMEQDDAIMTTGKARMLTVSVAPGFATLQFLRMHGLADGTKKR